VLRKASGKQSAMLIRTLYNNITQAVVDENKRAGFMDIEYMMGWVERMRFHWMACGIIFIPTP